MPVSETILANTSYRNPDTGRQIKKYNNTKFEIFQGVLAPRQEYRNEYLYDLNNRYYVKSNSYKLKKHQVIANQMIRNKDDVLEGPKGRYITRNSRAFKKYLKLNFAVIGDKLISPTNYDVYDTPDLRTIATMFKESPPKAFTVASAIGDDYNIFHGYRTSFEVYKSIIYVLHERDIYSYKVYLHKTIDTRFGPSYDGSQNCVIQAIENHYTTNNYKLPVKESFKQLYNEFSEGVFEAEMQDLAERIRTNIIIYENDNKYEYKQNSRKKKRIVLHYRNNHVESLKEEKFDPEVVSIDNRQFGCTCIDNLTLSEEHPVFLTCTCNGLNDLNGFIQTLDYDTIEKVLSSNGIYCIVTKTHTYKLKYYIHEYDDGKREYIELSDKEYTLSSKAAAALKKYYSNPIQPIHTDLACVDQILSNSIFYQQGKMHDPYALDVKNAYDNFGELPTDLLIKTSTLTPELSNHIGFYLITYTCPFVKQEVTRWTATRYVKCLEKHDISYVFHQAMLSSNTTTLDIAKFYKDTNFKAYNKRIFHIELGKYQKYIFDKRGITTDIFIANKYGGIELVPGLYQYSKSEYLSTRNYYPHITATIHGDCNVKLLDLMMTYDLKPLRIWVDSIVCEKGSFEQFVDNVPDGFRLEKKNYKIQFDDYINTDNHIALPSTYDDVNLPKDRLSLVEGKAGTGKTHWINQIYKNIPNTVVLGPTNCSLRHHVKSQTIHSYVDSENFHMNNYNASLILIDEISMVSDEHLKMIINKTNCKIILIGDPKHQLPVVSGTPIDYSIIPTRTLTKIYRQEDVTFAKNLDDTFTNLDLSYITQRVTFKDAILRGFFILSPTNKGIDYINIMGYNYSTAAVINDKLKEMSPIIINSNKLKKKGLVNGDIGYIKDNHTLIVNNKEFKIDESQLDYVSPAYSVSYHKAQGMTTDKSVVINTFGLEHFPVETKKQMLYVGCSRVRELKQLYLAKKD